MKNVSIIIGLLILSISAFAQDEDGMKTLFGNGRITGAYGAFGIKASPVRNDLSLFLGAEGAVIINDHAYLGIGGTGMSSRQKFIGKDVRDTASIKPNINVDMTSFGYGGILLGYTINPNGLIHVDIPILIGAGGVDLGDDNITLRDNDYIIKPSIESSAFFVLEPGLNVEMNMTRYCRVAIGGGYRFIYGTDLVNLKDQDLTDWTANFTIKFGKF